jgi:hypothetical protein
MLDVEQYLAAIGYLGPLEPSLPTLRGLQECHIRAVPYHSQPSTITASLADADFDLGRCSSTRSSAGPGETASS